MITRLTFAVLALALLGTVACATDGDVVGLNPALGRCPSPPAPGDVPEGSLEGFVLPPEVITRQVRSSGDITNLIGYIARTPLEVRAFYEDLEEGQIVNLEDEVIETEVLIVNGEHNTFARFSAICERGSRVVALVGSRGSSGIPTPSGTLTPSP